MRPRRGFAVIAMSLALFSGRADRLGDTEKVPSLPLKDSPYVPLFLARCAGQGHRVGPLLAVRLAP